jgi:hypothetical protein
VRESKPVANSVDTCLLDRLNPVERDQVYTPLAKPLSEW